MKRFVWIISLLFVLLFSFILTVSAQEWPGDLPEQAKKEGVVSWYTTAPVPEAKELADIFEKRYPFIKVEIFRSGGGAIANRVLAEHNAGSYMVDIIHGIASRGAIPPFRKKGIIMKYKFPEWKFVPGDLKDKEGYWTTFYQLPLVLAYNTNLVKSKDVPKTYEDLLKPKWKGGQILNDTENFVWFGTLLKHWGKEKGLAYFRKLARQDLVFQRGNTARSQLVLAGEFPLTISYANIVQNFTSAGAPLNWVPLEPVPINLNTVSLARRAPHPAGARLFINFLFSKEAHLLIRKFRRIPSRVDVDANPPRLSKGYRRIPHDVEEQMSETIDLYRKTFGLSR